MATTFNKAPQQTFSREKIQAEGIPPDVMAFAQQATATQESITSARDIVSQSTQTFSEQDPTYTAAFTPEPPTYVSATEPLPISSSSTTTTTSANTTTAARSSTAPASSSLFSKSPHRPLPTQFRPTLATRSSHHYAQASAASREERAWNQANALKKVGRGEMAGQGELGKGREGLGRGPSFDEQEYRRVMQRKSVALEGRGLGEMRAEVDGYSSGVGE